jgi:hypothetical protein
MHRIKASRSTVGAKILRLSLTSDGAHAHSLIAFEIRGRGPRFDERDLLVFQMPYVPKLASALREKVDLGSGSPDPPRVMFSK